MSRLSADSTRGKIYCTFGFLATLLPGSFFFLSFSLWITLQVAIWASLGKVLDKNSRAVHYTVTIGTLELSVGYNQTH